MIQCNNDQNVLKHEIKQYKLPINYEPPMMCAAQVILQIHETKPPCGKENRMVVPSCDSIYASFETHQSSNPPNGVVYTD